MKIVVLAGGISTEREVSLVSGTGVCRALRKNGHRAILVDLFLGLEQVPADLDTLFDAPDGLCADVRVRAQAPDLEAVRRSRPDQSPSHIGPHVLEVCAAADIVFLGLHGMDGEDGRIQAALDLLGVPYTGAGCLASAIAMDKDMTKRLVSGLVTTPRWETVTVTADNLEELVEQPAQLSRDHREVLEAVLSLPARYRDVVYLHYYEEYTAPEIARILGKNVNTVYTLLERYLPDYRERKKLLR